MLYLYQLSKASTTKSISLRFSLLTKKNKKAIQTQQLVYLRAPKHFNIGKSKVKSINQTTTKHLMNINTIFCTHYFINKINFKIVKGTITEMTLKCITSFRLRIKCKVLWVSNKI